VSAGFRSDAPSRPAETRGFGRTEGACVSSCSVVCLRILMWFLRKQLFRHSVPSASPARGFPFGAGRVPGSPLPWAGRTGWQRGVGVGWQWAGSVALGWQRGVGVGRQWAGSVALVWAGVGWQRGVGRQGGLAEWQWAGSHCPRTCLHVPSAQHSSAVFHFRRQTTGGGPSLAENAAWQTRGSRSGWGGRCGSTARGRRRLPSGRICFRRGSVAVALDVQ